MHHEILAGAWVIGGMIYDGIVYHAKGKTGGGIILGGLATLFL